MNKRRWRVRERHKKRTEQSSWHDGWLTGFNKLDVPYKYECFLSLSPKSLPLPLEHCPRVTEKANAHMSSISTIAAMRDRHRERTREGERQEEVINYQEVLARQRRTCTPASLQLTHTCVYTKTHTHTHSWGRGAWRLLPQTVKPAETIGIKPDAHVRQ